MLVVSLTFKEDHVALGREFQREINQHTAEGYRLHSWRMTADKGWLTLVAVFERVLVPVQ